MGSLLYLPALSSSLPLPNPSLSPTSKDVLGHEFREQIVDILFSAALSEKTRIARCISLYLVGTLVYSELHSNKPSRRLPDGVDVLLTSLHVSPPPPSSFPPLIHLWGQPFHYCLPSGTTNCVLPAHYIMGTTLSLLSTPLPIILWGRPFHYCLPPIQYIMGTTLSLLSTPLPNILWGQPFHYCLPLPKLLLSTTFPIYLWGQPFRYCLPPYPIYYGDNPFIIVYP